MSVQYSFNSESGENGVEPHINDASRTANNQLSRRMFFANTYVRDVRFPASWDIESVWDKLTFQIATSAITTVTGTSTGSTINVTENGNTLQWQPVKITFTTDASVTSNGFNITSAEVCCATTTDAIYPEDPLQPGMRNDGVLLATNDVVYFRYPARTSGVPLKLVNIVLTGQAGTGFNPNLYARCGAVPTPSAYTERSISADRYEFVSISFNECASPNDIFIAVHSASGTGSFSLVASPSQVQGNLQVVIETNLSSEITAVKATVNQALHQLYGATEGQVFITHFNTIIVAPGSLGNDFDDCIAACGGTISDDCICFIQESTFASHAQIPGAAIISHGSGTALGDWGDADVVAHEFGHALLTQPDEYDASNGQCTRCGHTIMENQYQPCNNLCIGGTHANHTLDRDAGCAAASNPSGWGRTGLLTQHHDYTPDIYDYSNHDFNGLPTF